MNIFVSIDGVDGVGKTTVSQRLAEECGFQYYKSPSGPFEALRKEVDKYASPIGRYSFYRLALQHDSDQIAKLLEKGPVVSDRYLASTLAYHLVLDPRIREIHQENGLVRPNFSILLAARSNIRTWRLEERRKKEGREASDIKLEDNSVLMNSVASMFETLGLIEVDTSDLTKEEVVVRVKNIIEGG